ncbi:MAG: hypothetical protein AB7F96_20320 [Beijerinckiaceae bacterium]
MSLYKGEIHRIPFVIPSTELLAGTPINLVSPVAGYIKKATAIVQTAVGTGGDITFKVGTTDVNGLTLTIEDSAAVGDIVTDTATALHASRAVDKDERIQVVPAAAFASTGAVNGYVEIETSEAP